MDLQQLYDDLKAVLAGLGLTEIEIELKPKSDGSVKIFASSQQPAASK